MATAGVVRRRTQSSDRASEERGEVREEGGKRPRPVSLVL